MLENSGIIEFFDNYFSVNPSDISKKDKSILINAITRSCKIKSSVVSKDESEKKLRMI